MIYILTYQQSAQHNRHFYRYNMALLAFQTVLNRMLVHGSHRKYRGLWQNLEMMLQIRRYGASKISKVS